MDGELLPELARELAAHLETCPACAAEKERMQRAMTSLLALTRIEPGAGFDAGFARKLGPAKQAQLRRLFTRLMSMPPRQRTRFWRNARRWRQLTPDQQEKLRRLYRRRNR